MVQAIIIMSSLTHLIILFSSLILLTFSSTSTLYTINANAGAYPSQVCSSYCMYQINANMNYNPLCIGSYSLGNGYCSKCDPLLFRAVTGVGGGFNCIPHLYNSQEYAGGGTYNYKFGYFQDFSRTWNNDALGAMPIQFSGLLPHFAIRIRFGITLYYFQFNAYTYPIQYSIDGTGYNYDQDLSKYWSPYDIITSPLQNHTDSYAAISFRLTILDYPYNSDSNCFYFSTNGFCYCYRGSPDFDCNGGANCCGLRYFQVNDLLVFVSRCQTGCLTCTSATYCKTCDWAGGGYYLNPVDHLCYLVCPQATFKDDATLFLASVAYATIEHWCSACPPTCLECSSLVVCTICYPYGRNQSFLFVGTSMCINPCINNYRGNYTTHVCVCPSDYFYEDTINFLCISCAAECVRCTRPTSLDCQYCQKGYYLAYQTTHCLLECPVGQYENDITRTCFLCDSSCTQCKKESTQCTECMFTSPMKYLLGQECLTWCPPGYSWENVTHRCQICAYNTYSLNGKCVRLCPSMYQADRTNRSCLHYSQTGYLFNLSLISVSILTHGKLIKFQILAQDGLNSTSYDMVMKRSYYNTQVVYKDSIIQSIPGIVRNLMDLALPIKNIQYFNNRIYYYTQLPSSLDYRKSFQIVFLQSIAGMQDIYYYNLTNVYSVSAHPQLMKSYYTFTVKNIYNIIIIPFITFALFLFTLQLKGVYDMYMELLRMAQMLGLLVYSSFPVGQYIFYFLVGCSYANLDFIPNLYAMATTPQSVNNFSSYNFTVDDMDFIRLNGSVLLFGFTWTIVVAIAQCLIKVKESRLDYMITFGLDLMEVKILHSFWSSLIFVVINYNATNFSVFATFAFAFSLFLGVIGRRYAIWKETQDYSPLFLWRLFGTFLICFISLANELLVSLVFCLSIIFTIWEFYLLHSKKYLINITDLNSQNYMSEKTYRILNPYDEEIRFCWAISIRNTIITITPLLTSLLISILILMKQSQLQAIIFTSVMLYFLLLLVIVNSVFVFFFLDERRKYLVQNKLEYLQKKYAKLNNNDTIVYEERKRPRVANNMTIFDQQKFLEQNPARSMMKNID